MKRAAFRPHQWSTVAIQMAMPSIVSMGTIHHRMNRYHPHHRHRRLPAV